MKENFFHLFDPTEEIQAINHNVTSTWPTEITLEGKLRVVKEGLHCTASFIKNKHQSLIFGHEENNSRRRRRSHKIEKSNTLFQRADKEQEGFMRKNPSPDRAPLIPLDTPKVLSFPILTVPI